MFGVRYTDDEKRRILEELAGSGLNRAAFCRERGLCYASVGAWFGMTGAASSNVALLRERGSMSKIPPC